MSLVFEGCGAGPRVPKVEIWRQHVELPRASRQIEGLQSWCSESSMSDESANTSESRGRVNERIRQVIDGMMHAGSKTADARSFLSALLDKVKLATESDAGAIWLFDEQGSLRMAHEVAVADKTRAELASHQGLHQRLLQRVARNGGSQLVPPQVRGADPADGGNPTAKLVMLAPLRSESRPIGAVELFADAEQDRTQSEEHLQVLDAVCRFAGDTLARVNRETPPQTNKPNDLWRQSDAFCRSIHGNLNLRATAYAIANDGRRLIGGDRVSVAVRRGTKYSIEAISGQDVFDKRANTIRLLERLTKTVVAAEDPLWYEHADEDLPPQIAGAINGYVEESLTKSIAIVPLHTPPELKKTDDDSGHVLMQGDVVGALIVEQIEEVQPWANCKERIELAAEHASRAIASAVEHHRIPLLPVWRGARKVRTWFLPKTLPKTAAILGAIACLLIALFAIPIDFTVEAEGVLQPVVRREVFVETPGVAKRIHVQHGADVEKGDLLVELENIELQVQKSKLNGELVAIDDQLRSFRRNLLDSRPMTEVEKTQASTEVGFLQKQRENLVDRIALIEDQLSQLRITAPAAGRVVTWKIDDLLQDRPVSVGDVLMTIANPKGDWELEVFMPESSIGHVAKAARKANGPLEVDYIPTTHPDRVLKGKLQSVHGISELHEQKGQSIRLQIEIDKADLVDPHPAATVTAKVHCGRRSIAYVYGHELWEFLQRNVFF